MSTGQALGSWLARLSRGPGISAGPHGPGDGLRDAVAATGGPGLRSPRLPCTGLSRRAGRLLPGCSRWRCCSLLALAAALTLLTRRGLLAALLSLFLSCLPVGTRGSLLPALATGVAGRLLPIGARLPLLPALAGLSRFGLLPG